MAHLMERTAKPKSWKDVAASAVRRFRDLMSADAEKHSTLAAEYAAVQREIDKIHEQLADESHLNKTQAEALAILDGGDVQEAAPEAARQSLSLKYSRRSALREAIKIHQQRTMDEKGKRSRGICLSDDVAEAHRRLLADTAEKLAAFSHALSELRAFRRMLEDGEISISHLGNGLPVPSSMCIDDPHSTVHVWLKNFEEDYGIKVKH